MMGSSQIDRYGNSNIANIGPFALPRVQLLGVRGGPGNTISHSTSFFIPNHTTRVFVERVDIISGLGYDRVAAMSETVRRHHRPPRVITNLAVLDFESPGHRMRLVSLHPGVSMDEVVAATGFELVIECGAGVSPPEPCRAGCDRQPGSSRLAPSRSLVRHLRRSTQFPSARR